MGTTAMMDAHPVLCTDAWEELLEVFELDAESIAHLIDIYRRETPRLMEELGVALEAGQLEAAWRAAHAAKAGCRNLGGRRAQALLQGIEDAGRAGELEEARRLFAEAIVAEAEFAAALERRGF